MVKIYGIKNCSTVKKALDWLKSNEIAFEFYDFKKEGVSSASLAAWAESQGWEKLINKKGTTWRKLGPAAQESIGNPEDAFRLLAEHTSLIKRPVVEFQDQVLLGFDEAAYSQLLK